MGSFQQISIGVICLVAAFAFGNYVNNNPPADHPLQPDIAVQNDFENPVGNVQSRLAGTDLEIIPKQPAQIATMRSPLKQRFKVPLANSSIPAPESASSNANSVGLPPPSQLRVEKSSEQSNPVAATPGSERTRLSKLNDIPDFSDIVSEFRNTQIELPPLGKMPAHANPNLNQTANVIPFAVRKPTSIGNVVDDAANRAAANQSQQPSFTADDFAPQLNNRFSNSSSTPASTPSDHPPQRSEQARVNSFGSPQQISSIPEDSSLLTTESASNGMTKIRRGAASLSRISQTPNTDSGVSNASNVLHQSPVNFKIASNHVVSRHQLPQDSISVAQIQEQPRSTDPRSNHGSSVLDLDDAASEGQNFAPPITTPAVNRLRTQIPFGLNEQGKSQLVAIKSRARSQLESKSTKFVDHVIQPGESLQSISQRYFGKPDFYLDIYLANRSKLRNPVDTPDGIAIQIPIY